MAKSIQAIVSTGSEDTNQTHHFEQGSGDRGHLKQIDLSSDRASNTVTLTLNDLLSMPASNGVHQLTLTGDANDSVNIDLAEWVNTGNAVSDGGHTYAVYSDVAMHSAQLLIDQAMLTAHHVS
jgi:hypothetical protein